MSKHVYSTANLSDTELKDQGNKLFAARKFEEAVNCYTKAIVSVVVTLKITELHEDYDAVSFADLSIFYLR